jgi:hypothetical protein
MEAGKQRGRRRVRVTVVIPDELRKFAAARSRAPEHAGRLASYLDSLIRNDQAGGAVPNKEARK